MNPRRGLDTVLKHSSGRPPATYLTYSSFKAAVGQLDRECACHDFFMGGKARAYCEERAARNQKSLYACQGARLPYVAVPPVAGTPGDLTAGVLCIPVLLRWLSARISSGSVPPAFLEAGLQDPPSGVIGPSTTFLVPGAEELEDGIHVPVEEDLQILVCSI